MIFSPLSHYVLFIETKPNIVIYSNKKISFNRNHIYLINHDYLLLLIIKINKEINFFLSLSALFAIKVPSVSNNFCACYGHIKNKQKNVERRVLIVREDVVFEY